MRGMVLCRVCLDVDTAISSLLSLRLGKCRRRCGRHVFSPCRMAPFAPLKPPFALLDLPAQLGHFFLYNSSDPHPQLLLCATGQLAGPSDLSSLLPFALKRSRLPRSVGGFPLAPYAGGSAECSCGPLPFFHQRPDLLRDRLSDGHAQSAASSGEQSWPAPGLRHDLVEAWTSGQASSFRAVRLCRRTRIKANSLLRREAAKGGKMETHAISTSV